jgi:hypothetical protein
VTFFSSTYVPYHVKIHYTMTLESPTTTISAASSEISLPHRNNHRYKTSAAVQSTGTSTTMISPARSPQFIVFFENKSHHHHAHFVTFFVMARCFGKSTFFLLVRFLKDNFAYFFNLHCRLKNCVVFFSFAFLHVVLCLKSLGRG